MKYIFYIAVVAILLNFCINNCYAEPTSVSPDAWQEQQNPENKLVDIGMNSLFPPLDWWKQFNDVHLNNYISLALANNLSIKVASANILASQAVVGQYKSYLRPTVNLQPEFQRVKTSDTVPVQEQNGSIVIPKGQTSNLYSFPLVASYELDLFGKNRLKVQSSQKIEQATVQNKRVVELAISSQVAGAYLNLVQTDALIKTTEELINVTSQSVQLYRQLYTGGVIPYDTVLLTEQNLAQYRQNLAEYKNQRSVFAHQLSILMAVKPQIQEHMQRQTIDDLNFPHDIPVGIPSQLLTHRPDVIEAELNMQSANINVKEARREFFPSLVLSGDMGFSSGLLSEFFYWGSHIYQMAATMVQSLYTGGLKTANLKYNKAVLEEQLNNYYNVLLSAFNDVENSLALFKTNYAEYQENVSEINTSTHYVGLAETRYKTGVGTRLDYLNAQNQFLTYKLLSQQNKSKSLIDLVSLYTSLGGGYSK